MLSAPQFKRACALQTLGFEKDGHVGAFAKGGRMDKRRLPDDALQVPAGVVDFCNGQSPHRHQFPKTVPGSQVFLSNLKGKKREMVAQGIDETTATATATAAAR